MESQSLQRYEGSEVTPTNEYFSKVVKIRMKITNCLFLYLIIIVIGQENYEYN